MRIGSRCLWLATLALVPLLANWPVTSGWLTIDPLYAHSGIGVGLRPGPLPGPAMLDGSGGWHIQSLGRLAAREWMSGRIPWWNPDSGPGLPLAAEGGNPSLFLPFVLLLALPNGLFLLALVLQEIAAFATFFLLRRMGLGVAAAWAGAALFSLNGTFAWLGDQPGMMPIAFAPLLLLGIEMEWRAAGGPARSWGWIVAAVAVALSLFAGFPEAAYIDGLLGAAWAGQRLFALPPGVRLRFAGRVAGAAVTGVLIAAPYVIPFLHLLEVGDVSVHAWGLEKSWMFADVLPVLSMPTVLGPHMYRDADPTGKLTLMWVCVGGYVPVAELVLAVAALLCRAAPRRGLRLVLGAWIAVVLATEFGIPGVTQAVYAIPGLSNAWLFRYAPASCELAAAVLAALAIDDWRAGRMGRFEAIGAAVLVGLAAGFSLVPAWHWVPVLLAGVASYGWWLGASVASAAIAGGAVMACLYAPPTRWRLGVVLASSVGTALVLFMVPRLSGLREAKVDAPAIAFLRDGLGLQRFYTLGPIVPHYGAYFGIASLNSQYVPNPRIWSDHIATALDPGTAPFFYFFSGTFPPTVDHVAQFVQHLPAFADLAVRYVVVARGDETLLRLASSGAQPLRLVYEDEVLRIFELATAAPYFEAPDGGCRVTPKSREVVETECARPARLIRRELFFDGWRATVNGSRVEIGREKIVQAVELPAGTATVSFRYAPPYAGVSGVLGLMGIVILGVGAYRRRTNSVSTPDGPRPHLA